MSSGRGSSPPSSSIRSRSCSGSPPRCWGILSELLFAALVVYAPPLQRVFGTAAVTPGELAFLLPFPFVVWGADELRRAVLRRQAYIPH